MPSAGTEDRYPRHGPERGDVFNGLMSGAVFAYADAVMGQDVQHSLMHKSGKTDAVAEIIAEHQEGGHIGHYAAMEGHPVGDGGHGMLPNAKVDVAACPVGRGEIPFSLQHGLIAGGKIGATAHKLGHHGRNGVEHLAGAAPSSGGGELCGNGFHIDKLGRVLGMIGIPQITHAREGLFCIEPTRRPNCSGRRGYRPARFPRTHRPPGGCRTPGRDNSQALPSGL